MRILHMRPKIGVGGASEYLIRLVEGSAANGHSVVVVSGGGEWGQRVRNVATYYDTIDLTPRVGQSASKPNIGSLILSSFKIAKIVRAENIDIINTHHRFASLTGKLVSKMTKVPVVSTMHEVREDSKRLTSLGLGHVVVTLSTMVKNFVTHTYHIRPERIHVIPMGIPIPAPLSSSRRASLMEEIGLENGAPIIGCIGRLVKRKGQTYLLQAIPEILKAYPSAQFVFVGDGQERSALETITNQLDIRRNVFFLGSRDDVTDLIGLFNFTVLPSLQEEFGIVLIESLAQKKPIVAAAVGGVPEIVKDHENGLLIPARDSTMIAEGVLYLLNNPSFISQFGANGYRMVEEMYSTGSFVERTEALYCSVIGKERGLRSS
jgi:glycosyltransferase involved in cell wall biosynthesis